jgi:hypothetical protein
MSCSHVARFKRCLFADTFKRAKPEDAFAAELARLHREWELEAKERAAKDRESKERESKAAPAETAKQRASALSCLRAVLTNVWRSAAAPLAGAGSTAPLQAGAGAPSAQPSETLSGAGSVIHADADDAMPHFHD